MAPKYEHLRLRIPTLTQYNPSNPKWDVWCGRTAGAMIANYYIATRVGGFEEAKGEFIENRRTDSAETSNFYYRGGPHVNETAVPGLSLMVPVYREKKEDGWLYKELFPTGDGARTEILAGTYFGEDEVIRRVDEIIRSLEAHNPVLLWTGLSSSNGIGRQVRHLVVASGYRVDGDGALWLHIDDPSSCALDSKGDLIRLTLERVMESSALGELRDVIQQVEPDMAIDDRPGRRYWLRAAALFRPNAHSIHSDTDFWCDHDDRKGFRVCYNLEPTDSPLAGAPRNMRYPVDLTDDDAIGQLWSAVALAREPFLLSSAWTWHNGIHIPFQDGVTASDGVYAIAQGTVVLAWFPEREEGPDRGMVVIRHAIDKKSLAIVEARNGELPEGAAWIHTLYANLAGGRSGAAWLLAKLQPEGDEPALRRFVPEGAHFQLMAEVDGAPVLLTPVADGYPHEVEEAELLPVAGSELRALPPPRTNENLWTHAAEASSRTHASHPVHLRLASKESMLVGIELTGKPWILENDRVKVIAGWEGYGRLYRKVSGSGAGRFFPESAKKGADFIEVEVTPELELVPVEVFRSNNLDRAFVEIRHVTETVIDNAAAIERHRHLSGTYEDLIARLTGESYANLEADDGVAHLAHVEGMRAQLAYREVIDHRIGTMGVLPGDMIGVHVEMFSTENIVAGSSAGGRWQTFEEIAGLDNGTADFFLQHLEGILSAGRSKQSAGGAVTAEPDPETLLSLLAAGGPVKTEEWLAHCAKLDNARELSQIVAHHGSEWALELVADDTNQRSAAKAPAEAREALFAEPIGTPGLETNTFYYFHPLRLLEWCRTGVDVWIGGPPTGERAPLTIVLEAAGGEFELVRQAEDDHYRVRLILGDATDDGEQAGEDDDDMPGYCRGKLRLEGLDAAVTELEVELRRHQVTRLSLTEPGGEVTPLRELGRHEFGAEFWTSPIAVAEDLADVVHLLGDVGGPLDALACGRATLLATARYNVEMPDTLRISAPRSAFAIVKVEVAGAVVEPPASGWDSANEHTVALKPIPDDYEPGENQNDDGYEEPVTRCSALSVRLELAPREGVASCEPVSLEVSGGDLGEPVTGTVQLCVREIPFDAKGQDVAKLQLYLSQILCGAHPCLRGKEGKIPNVDGHYGPGTAQALWRFLLHYRPFGATAIAASKGEAQLDATARTPEAIEAEVKRLYGTFGGPLVAATLRDAIVEHYRVPNVGVACSLRPDMPSPREYVPELAAKWKDWNDAQRTRVAPLPDFIVLPFTVEADARPPGLEDLEVEVALVDAGAYRLLGADESSVQAGSTTTMGELLALGLRLAPTGEVTGAKAKPQLVIRDLQGRQIVALGLGGALDVRSGNAKGLDAIFIQHWLSKVEKKPNKFYLTGDVDGVFGDGSKSAFDDFCDKEFKKKDDPSYPEILELLRARVLPAPPSTSSSGFELGLQEPAL